MLTAKEVGAARPKDRDYRLPDERGLYLQVMRTGGKLWRFRYRIDGREKMISLGSFPDVGLADARVRRDDARRLVANGIDPSARRKAEKTARVDRAANSFKMIALEWHAKFSPGWVPDHAAKIVRRLEKDVFPQIGARPVAEIKAPEVLAVLRKIEGRSAVEAAHRALQECSRVFRYAVSTGRAESDPCRDLRGALPPVKEKHHASITDPKAIGGLLRAIDGYSGQPTTAAALRLAALTFTRPGELRHAEWQEIDLEAAEWRIPAEKMKMRQQHIVPLSRQALEILKELHPLTSGGRYVFPALRGNGRPLSENTLNAGLRRLGFSKDEMTSHGFRSMASTRLHELGFPHEVIERQLAHSRRDKVAAAYDYSQHLPERREMMQEWANYLDVLRAGNVVPLEREKMIA